MPSKNARGQPYRSKIATIQEFTNFPQAEYTLPPEDIDLPEREGYAKHTLVGLNLFLIEMAQQFRQVLGIRTDDPMLARRSGATGLETTESEILKQAAEHTAQVGIDTVVRDDGVLSATVRIENKAGHKFPSGVAFRRAFVEFSVLDADERVLWSSGRSDTNGVIVDDKGETGGGRAVVDLRLRRTHRAGDAAASAAFSGHHRSGPGTNLRGAGGRPAGCGGANVWSPRQAGRKADHELPVDLRQGEGQPPLAAWLSAIGGPRQDRRRARRQA